MRSLACEALETAAWSCLHPCASSAPPLCGRATVDPSDARRAARRSVPAPFCLMSAPPRLECDGTLRCPLPHPAPTPRLRAPAPCFLLTYTRAAASCDAFRDQKSECMGTSSMLRAAGATPCSNPASAPPRRQTTPHHTQNARNNSETHLARQRGNYTPGTQPRALSGPTHLQHAAGRCAHARKPGNKRQRRSYAACNAATPDLHQVPLQRTYLALVLHTGGGTTYSGFA